jgi:hypothetical protein
VRQSLEPRLGGYDAEVDSESTWLVSAVDLMAVLAVSTTVLFHLRKRRRPGVWRGGMRGMVIALDPHDPTRYLLPTAAGWSPPAVNRS